MRSAIAARPSASSSPPASAEAPAAGSPALPGDPALPAAPALTAEDWRAGGFGVYVHWPFCAAKCPYCDFNSHVRRGIDQDRWRRALVAEIVRVAAEVPERRVDSVFFGGGTPSLMPAATVAAVLEAVDVAWGLAADAEVTLEANPTSVEAGRFAEYRAAGVNRLSLGVQALDDCDLRRLGRLHSAEEALAALRLARETFSRVSIDLIYARQDQTPQAWEVELRRALALGIDHLSLYQLTIEPGTRFHDLRARGGLTGLPEDARAAGLFEATQEICAAAGLPAYEISNHARPGVESRHNRVYWRYGDYAGIGPGAHGRLTVGAARLAVATLHAPEAWLDAVETRGSGEAGRAALGSEEQAAEMLMMGLRLVEGVEAARYVRLARRPLAAEAIAELAAMELVVLRDGRLRATAAGRAVLEAVLRRLLADA
jgi:putative oxygen-independent coproporphyrinogen III oxidase